MPASSCASLSFALVSASCRATTASINAMASSEAVAELAVKLQQQGIPYSVIVYYKAQRSRIERHMAEKQKDWADFVIVDKVFTIDSYQGQENDCIIFSTACDSLPPLVPTPWMEEPPRHYVLNVNRLTVALSRCSKMMLIVTNKRYIQAIGRYEANNLLFKLCKQCVPVNWYDDKRILFPWIDSLAAQSADQAHV